jgi:hypothetical protein
MACAGEFVVGTMQEPRLKFGPHKYAALSLLVGKWARNYSKDGQSYCYVTLGGAELYDVAYLSWIDKALTHAVKSYEQDPKKYILANRMAQGFRDKGINIEVIPDDIFQFQRRLEMPHLYYLDLLGICSPDPFRRQFKRWFEDEVVRAGDLLLITSYLGRNPGWDKVLRPFDSEFRLLRVDSSEERKRIYNTAHPLLVMNRALQDAGLHKELSLKCIGFVKYRDTSVMGLYGILCEDGSADLRAAISGISVFSSIDRSWSY